MSDKPASNGKIDVAVLGEGGLREAAMEILPVLVGVKIDVGGMSIVVEDTGGLLLQITAAVGKSADMRAREMDEEECRDSVLMEALR